MPPLTYANAYGLHKRLCKELGIAPLPRRRFILRAGNKDSVTYGRWRILANEALIFSRPIKRDKEDWRRVVAHETYHYYQAMRGWLGRIDIECRSRTQGWAYIAPTRSWKGKPTRAWPSGWYKSLPWERGAFAYEKRMAKKYGWKA